MYLCRSKWSRDVSLTNFDHHSCNGLYFGFQARPFLIFRYFKDWSFNTWWIRLKKYLPHRAYWLSNDEDKVVDMENVSPSLASREAKVTCIYGGLHVYVNPNSYYKQPRRFNAGHRENTSSSFYRAKPTGSDR